MGVTMQSVWTCDGCGVKEVKPENYNPPGWVNIQAILMTGQRNTMGEDFVYFVCATCWTAATWVREGKPSLHHKQGPPPFNRPGDPGTIELRWPSGARSMPDPDL